MALRSHTAAGSLAAINSTFATSADRAACSETATGAPKDATTDEFDLANLSPEQSLLALLPDDAVQPLQQCLAQRTGTG